MGLFCRSLVADDQLTVASKYCVFVDNTVHKLPLAQVKIDTPYSIGSVHAVCMTNPIYDVIVGKTPQACDPDPNRAFKDDKKSEESEHEWKRYAGGDIGQL